MIETKMKLKKKNCFFTEILLFMCATYVEKCDINAKSVTYFLKKV